MRRAVPTSAMARRNFGMALLGVVVFAWVSSNFLTHVWFSNLEKAVMRYLPH